MPKVVYLFVFIKELLKIIQPLGIIHFSSYSLREQISIFFDISFMQEARIDIKLPRRSLIVKFTCNACGERTERLINRLAFERGTVFVQVYALVITVMMDSCNTFVDHNVFHLFFICVLRIFGCDCNFYPLYALEESCSKCLLQYVTTCS